MPRIPDHSAQEFIERMGVAFDSEGLPKGAGRLMAYLVLVEEAESAEEIMGALGMSRGGVSSYTRFLEARGLVERITRPHERRVYYRMRDDAFASLLEGRLRKVRNLRRIVDDARGSLPERLGRGRERLDEMARFYQLVIQKNEDTLARWRAGKAGS